MTTLSTHLLDLGEGAPASGVQVVLEVERQEGWTEVTRSATDSNGRVAEIAADLESGTYRLRFLVGGFYPEIHVVTELDGDEPHYHLPVLLSPYGYSTYRGV
jgi:5-hydroxyisourate hydrolase